MAKSGHFILLLAFALSSCAIAADLLGKWRRSARWMCNGRNITLASFNCLTLAVTILVIVLFRSDPSVAYVARHTANELAPWYRIGGLWTGAEGSLLLWLWIQAGFIAIVFCKCQEDRRLFCADARIAANLVCVFFLLALTFKMNLFAASETAADGVAVDPRPPHPLTALYPPILLTGYATSAVPFAWSFARLKCHAQGPAPLVKQFRNWILAAWLLLTIGVVLSAWSAYEQLGSEGYWFRDVAQDVSLMPWLPATALLFLSPVQKRNSAAAKWMVMLSLVTFSLCISAAFLKRPGLISGMHALPEPALGRLFTILLIHIWVLAAIYWRNKGSRPTKSDRQPPDKTEEIRCDS